MNQNTKKIATAGVSALLAAGLLAGSVEYASHTFREENASHIAAMSREDVQVLADDGDDKVQDVIQKEETVYINADASGEVQDVTVSNWLKTSGVEGEVQEDTILEDIQNVKGEETFRLEDGTLAWQAEDKDIYYQGKTDKELPIAVNISYRLDGKEMDAKEMIGKSGKMEMTVSYENKAAKNVQIDGKKEEITVPFMLVTGMFLSTDTFDKVEVDGGKVISEGNNQIVVGMGMPGLAKSMDFDKEAEEKIPSSFTVTADVKDFEMGNTFTYASSSLLGDLSFDDMEDLDGLTDSLDDLLDASSQLLAGSSDLKDGMDELASQYGKFDEGVNSLDEGIKELKKGGQTLRKGAYAYVDGTDSLTDGVKEYVKGSKTYTKGVKSYVKGSKKITKGIKQLGEGVASLPENYDAFSTGITTYTEGVKQLTNPDNMSLLKTGSAKLAEGVGTLHDGATKVGAGLDTLHQSLADLEKSYENNMAILTSLKTGFAAMQTSFAGVADDGTKEKMEQMSQAIATLEQLTKGQEAGVSALKEATADEGALQKGVDSMVAATGQKGELKAGADTLAGSLSTFAEGASSLYSSTASLQEANSEIKAGLGSVTGAVGQLTSGAEQLRANDKTLLKGGESLESAGKKLDKGAKKLGSNSGAVRAGIRKLLLGADALGTGSGKLKSASSKLMEGINKLQNGSLALCDGMQEFDKKGMQKIDEIVKEDLENVKERFEALQNASKEYNTFSGIGKNMDGTVKFIYETEALEAEDEEE